MRTSRNRYRTPRAFIERFRYKATKVGAGAVAHQANWPKLERVEVDEVDTSHLNLKFPPAPRSGDYPVIAEGVGKSYGDHLVFADATFTIKRGEKVAFVGKNGEGKSNDGQVHHGRDTLHRYFEDRAQREDRLLCPEPKRACSTSRSPCSKPSTEWPWAIYATKIRDILGAFMFGGEASDKKVKVLSGGERTRLAMIRACCSNRSICLILDEPTNHLDMRTKDVLKQAIRDFNGTVIVVSHDREFLDGLVSKVYEFGGGRVREHLGGIYDFLESRKLESLRELEQRNPAAPAADKKATASESRGCRTCHFGGQ